MRRILLLWSLLIVAQAFLILRKGNSKTHQDITRIAILRATAKVCECVEGFTKPKPLDTETLARSCKKDAFTKNFETGIKMISYYNVKTDVDHLLEAKYHFHAEKFVDGKMLIIKGVEDITKDIRKNKFADARKKLGKILHTLQDFYSHSNWIELGNTKPCTALINSEENIPNPAKPNQETCECPTKNCEGNILKNIIDENILTSGYFGIKKKPKGKCSHGGPGDITAGLTKSLDGINKDASDSSHGSLHNKAADVAIDASVQLLEKIWKNNNEANFFRLMGLHMEKPTGEWKTRFSLFKLKSRYPDATKDSDVEV
ncbi:von Willebrand factor A domain-containing protein 7-like [Sinocyclocheilus anshuiensis]|uniref:von Willebrand factor A domain-containing protein 7-like n=1 Tax=Sinocyclocheilus anshuiensis TaxID=1608454 RepID=UPI0007B9E619|nr:PREDICTED: von Willebrand factor A domain-containing protein 7-like [Sinocyclocheilus anshuiensis]